MDGIDRQWDRLIGERVRLRELRILHAVVRCGSMAKAAAVLAMTQPAVSQAIALLETALRVKLLERGPRGVVPTLYGEALLRRGLEAFDVLKQGMREIEALAEPGAGQVFVGASESHIAGGFLAEIIQELSARHPRMDIHVSEANTAAPDFAEIRSRKLDIMLGRIAPETLDDDLRVDRLFDEPLYIVAGSQNAWAHAPAIKLADLLDKPWVLAPPNTAVYNLVLETFRQAGLPMPTVHVTTYSMTLRLQLLSQGQFVTAFPGSLMRFNAQRWDLKVLPLSLGKSLPVAIVTLKNRTQSPAVRLFIAHALAATKRLRDANECSKGSGTGQRKRRS